MSKTTKARKDLSYGDAATRLDEILGIIEEGEVDIDALSGLVEEAAELVNLCRNKIHAAEVKVKTITEQLERDTDDETPAGNENAGRDDLPENIRY